MRRAGSSGSIYVVCYTAYRDKNSASLYANLEFVLITCSFIIFKQEIINFEFDAVMVKFCKCGTNKNYLALKHAFIKPSKWTAGTFFKLAQTILKVHTARKVLQRLY